MDYFVAAFLVFILSALAMGVGVLFHRTPPRKNCGELTSAEGRCHCDGDDHA